LLIFDVLVQTVTESIGVSTALWLSNVVLFLTSAEMFCCQATVAKKKIFYGMKVKTLRRKFSDICNRLTAIRDHLAQPYEDRIRTLYSSMKEVRLLLFTVNLCKHSLKRVLLCAFISISRSRVSERLQYVEMLLVYNNIDIIDDLMETV